MKAATFLMILLLGSLSFFGCGNQGGGQSKAGHKLLIAVVPKGSTHHHWKNVHAGAAQAARELGVELVWQGPHQEDDRQMQIQVVQNLVSSGVDALVLAPLDERSLVPPVQAAVKRGIPVVVIDSDLRTDVQSSFIATNNRAGGRRCAQRLAEVMGGRGKALMLKCHEGSAATEEREAGFLEGMREYGPRIVLVSTDQYSGATFEKAFQVSQNLLNRFGEVEGVFCSFEGSTQGMLRALQLAGRVGGVKLVGFDVNPTLVAALEKGEVHGLAVQDPFRIGYLGLQTATAVLRKQPFERIIDTGVMMVTRENLHQSQAQRLINPVPGKQ